jgi:hypothetical protein
MTLIIHYHLVYLEMLDHGLHAAVEDIKVCHRKVLAGLQDDKFTLLICIVYLGQPWITLPTWGATAALTESCEETISVSISAACTVVQPSGHSTEDLAVANH